MNAMTLITTLAALLPLAAMAAPPPSAPTQAMVQIEVDCTQPRLPDQQTVSRLLGIDNFGQAYAARARLMVNAQRDCKRLGAARLILVLEDPGNVPRRNRGLASAASRP